MEKIFLLLALFIPWSFGWAVCSFLFGQDKSDTLLRGGISFGLGLGFLSFWMLALSSLNMVLTPFVIGGPFWAAVLVLFVIARWRPAALPLKKETEPWSFWERSLVLLIAVYVFYVFWTAMSLPVHVWDEIERVVFKAKIFFYDGTLDSLQTLPHPAYPLLMEFSLTWIAQVLNVWNDQLLCVVSPLFLLSFLILYYSFLKEFTVKTWALGGGILFLSSPLLIHHATMLYVDMPLMFYNCGTIFLLFLWHKKGKNAYLWLASFLVGMATFCKLEGMFYLLIYVILFLFLWARQKDVPAGIKRKQVLVFIGPAFLMTFFYLCFKMSHGLPLTERTGVDFSLNVMNRFPSVIEAFIRNLFLSGNWGLVWILLLISFARVDRLRSCFSVQYLFLGLILFLGLQFIHFWMTPNFYWISDDKAYGVLARLVLHFYPLAPAIIILLNGPERIDKSNGGT